MCGIIYLLNMGKFNVALREVVAGGTLGRKCMALVWLPRFFLPEARFTSNIMKFKFNPKFQPFSGPAGIANQSQPQITNGRISGTSKQERGSIRVESDWRLERP